METYEISTENILFLIWKFVIFDSKEFFPFSRSLFSVSVFFCMFTYSQQCHLTKKHLQFRPWSYWLLVFWLEEDFDATLEHKNRTSKAAFINKGQWSRQGCNSKDFYADMTKRLINPKQRDWPPFSNCTRNIEKNSPYGR